MVFLLLEGLSPFKELEYHYALYSEKVISLCFKEDESWR